MQATRRPLQPRPRPKFPDYDPWPGKIPRAQAGQLLRAALLDDVRIHLLGDPGTTPSVPRMVADALYTRRVLRIGYVDRGGVSTTREIEPLGYVGTAAYWYLMAWCRLRDTLRAFRTDRITSVSVTAEVPMPRSLRSEDLDIPPGKVHQLTLS